MGDLTEMILDGVLCQYCGAVTINGGKGYPQSCNECSDNDKKQVVSSKMERTNAQVNAQ